MKMFKVGDSQKAICDHCRSLVNTTLQLCDVPFSDGSGVAREILVGVCDQCGQICLLPHQSTPAVKQPLDVSRGPIESR